MLERTPVRHPGVVDHDVETTGYAHDRLDRLLYGSIVGDIHLDEIQREVLSSRQVTEFVRRGHVLPCDRTHAREDGVSTACQRFDDQTTEAA